MGSGQEERIVAALFKSLKDRHEILRYLRLLIIEQFKENLEKMTDAEVTEYLQWMKHEQAKEKR
jgi:hypothetical protein